MVEQTIPHTFIKRDLLGIIDILVILPDRTIGIQVTSGANHSARVKKALATPALDAWLNACRTFAVWSWAKRGGVGKRKTWQLREQDVSRKTFHEGQS